MAFELSPNNRDQPDSVLLDDLRSASSKLGGQKLSREAYSKVGRFAPATIATRFGGWGRALVQAGLVPPRHFSVSRGECLADIRRVADQLGIDTLSLAAYKRHGQYSEKPIKNHFAGWVDAIQAAGLRVSDSYHPRSSNEELFENLETVWEGLGRQPTVNDMVFPLSRFSAEAYKRRFGGFRRALEAFVVASNSPGEAESEANRPEAAEQGPLPASATEEPAPSPGNRSVGWRLRYLVLQRDRFCCRACGRSPANEPGTRLQVDHVVPWSRGGMTAEGNLQTLCERCNIGKGAG